jgi:hypothetical protein
MKKLTSLLLATGVLLGASSALAAAAQKSRTYTVVGYYDRTQPKQELLTRAASEIGAKMKESVAVENQEDADQIVQVLFKADGTYRIYWDALPLAPQRKQFEKPLMDLNIFRTAEGKSGEFPPKP